MIIIFNSIMSKIMTNETNKTESVKPFNSSSILTRFSNKAKNSPTGKLSLNCSNTDELHQKALKVLYGTSSDKG